MNRSRTSRAAVLLAALSFIAVVAACGARGPLDDDAFPDAGGTGADVGTVDVSTIPDAAPPPLDAPAEATSEGGSIIECGACLITSCGADILKCIQATGCRTTLQCVATTCLGSGTPSPACLFNCASGDPTGALQIFQIFQSVSSGSSGGGEKAVEWIRSLNRHAMRPDFTIVIDLAPELAAERRASRGEAAQLYEQNEVQRALAVF